MGGGDSGGGGGDGGYAAEKAAEEARRKAARAKIAKVFGIKSDRGAAPTMEQFRRPVPVDRATGLPVSEAPADPRNGAVTTTPMQEDIFDMTGYNTALSDYNAVDADTEKNRLAREADYSRVGGDVRSFHRDRMNTDLEKVARKLKFALLGSGNYGGSGQIDAQTDLDQTRDRGVADIENLANQTSSSVRASDTDKYTALVNAINAGMDEGSAAEAATAHTSTQAQRAIEQARGVSFANLFDRFSNDRLYGAYNTGAAQADPYSRNRSTARTPGSGGSGGGYYGFSS